MTTTYAVTIDAVRNVRELTGFSLRKSLEQVRAIVALANNGTLLAPSFFLITHNGLTTMATIYAAVGVA